MKLFVLYHKGTHIEKNLFLVLEANAFFCLILSKEGELEI